MGRALVIDSSTLIAIARANLFLKYAAELKNLFNFIIPEFVDQEVAKRDKMAPTLKELISSSLIHVVKVQDKARVEKVHRDSGLGRGEIACCLIAHELGLDFILCDDQKFLRTRGGVKDETISKMEVLGFSFILVTLYKIGTIAEEELRALFQEIIRRNNWRNSIIESINRIFIYGTVGIWV